MWVAIAISLLGAAVTTAGILATQHWEAWAQRNKGNFIGFAATTLISVSFLHLIPEALEMSEYAPWGMLAGFGLMQLLDSFLVGHVCRRPQRAAYALGVVPLIGLGFHSTLDGLVYSIGFNVSAFTGLTMAAGMVAHEFPEGVVTYALLRCGGVAARPSFWLAFAAAALTTPLGTLASFTLIGQVGDQGLGLLLGASAGALLYVGATHLLAQVELEDRAASPIALGAGFLVAVLLVLTGD